MSPQPTDYFPSPIVPAIAVLSEPRSDDFSELLSLSDLDDEYDELLPGEGNNQNMRPPLSRPLESQQVQVQAVSATVTTVCTSSTATVAQRKRKSSSPSPVALSTAGQPSSPSLRTLPGVPLGQEPTPKIVRGPSKVPERGLPKPPIIIQDSDSDNEGDGVGRQNLLVPAPISHFAVPPEPAKSMGSGFIDKSIQIVDLTSIDDEAPCLNLVKRTYIASGSHFNHASSSGCNTSVLSPTRGQPKLSSNSDIFSSRTPSTKLQTLSKSVHGLRRTGTGASVQDAIDLDAGSDVEENNGDEIVNITAEQYEAARALRSQSGHVKGKTTKGSISIPIPILTPMKAKAKIPITNGMNAENPTPSSSTQPSSQTKRKQINASHLSSTTSIPQRPVGECYHT